jgi:small subunit ribosomal protein S1
MTEDKLQQPAPEAGGQTMDEISFAELFEMEENKSVSKVGDVLTGTVVGIVEDHVLIDIGDKAESYIPTAEFSGDCDPAEIQIGDSFEV